MPRSGARYGLTSAEIRKYRKQCPTCKSRTTGRLGTDVGYYYECYECGHQWEFCARNGMAITADEYFERENMLCAKYREGDGIVAKTKKAVKKVAKKDVKKVVKKSVVKKIQKKVEATSKTPDTKPGPAASSKMRARTSSAAVDPRLPKIGTKLTATYKGKSYTATVVKDGIKYGKETYSTVSKVGKIITGYATNGYVFFGLNG